jgi:acetyl-CoA acetyltransferase
MTPIGKFLDKTLKEMSREAVEKALSYAGISKEQLQAAYVGNLGAGIITGQHSLRGQVVLRAMGIGDISIVNIEDACATGCAAIHLAWLDVASGFRDCVLALGMEKLYHVDKQVTFQAVNSVRDVDLKAAPEEARGSAIDIFAEMARHYMANYGLTKEQLAMVCSKNHFNGSLNPFAQYRKPMTVEEILAGRVVVDPITVPMCAPIGDGAAAAVVCSAEFAKRYTTHPVSIVASVFRTGKTLAPGEPFITKRASQQAYEIAGMGPSEIGVFEISDATTFTEIEGYELLGICAKGEQPSLIQNRSTEINGRYPVNPSGGLESKGHPFGATGIAQVVELVWQLRGEAGERQVPGPPKSALAEMHGGDGSPDWAAAEGITILKS